MGFTFFVVISLLLGGSVGLQLQPKKGRKLGGTLCPSYPYPTVDPSTLLRPLGPLLEEVGQNMSSLIKSTPGGAVVIVVYRDTVIWTVAGGLINISGELAINPCPCLIIDIYYTLVVYSIYGLILISFAEKQLLPTNALL